MSLVKVQGNASGTGIFTVAAPNSNTDRTLTLPDATGTLNVSGAANEVPAGSASTPSIYPTGDTNTGIFFPSSDTIAFTTAGSERARITSGGDMLVGTTSTSTPTSSTADVYLGGIVMPPSRRTTGSGANVNIDPTSGIFARSTSSLKYKKDVLNAPWGLADAMNLRAVTYKSVVEADGDTVFGGFIAEEVHAAGLTEFVQYAPDGSPDALAYGNMVALCIKAIQEQQALITSLTARIAALEGTSNV